MAVIGKIREKSTFLLIVVGGALMAFVLTDLFSSRSSVFGNDLENIGSIDGVNIRGVDFNYKYEEELENYKTREKTSNVPEFVQSQLRDQVWNNYLSEQLLTKELEKLGVNVSVEELGDLAYGDNPHPQVRQAFTNPETGQFNKNDVINFLKNMDRDETGKTKAQWLVFERAIKEERKVKKYYAMIEKGLFVTDQEAKDYFKGQNKRMAISFVVKRYADVADSTVEISESDIKSYYSENKNSFKEKKSRKIEYAFFDVLPSQEDSAAIKEWVDKTYASFKITNDDSSFVNANSDREFDYRFYSRTDNNPTIDTNLFKKDSVGYTAAAQIEGDNWKLVKISKIKQAPDSVEARHILIPFTEKNKAEIQARVDSIKNAISAGTDFALMAGKYSVDPGSKEEGGSLGWFREGFMIPVINDSCFEGRLNNLMTIESPFGIHLLEVTGKSPSVKKLQVAIIYRSIDASKETVDRQFTASNDFSLSLEGDAEMKMLVADYKVPYREAEVKENDNQVGQIESSRGLVRWAYNAEVGQVSEAMQYGSAFVVAKLLEVHEDGIAPLESVRAEAELGAIKEKKAEMFVDQMNGFTDIDEAAKSLSTRVEFADNVVFESYAAPVLGREPNVVGKAFTLEEGDLSLPIKGEQGVYIIRLDRIEEEALPEGDKIDRNVVNQTRVSRVNFEVFEALKERVEIVDNRYKVY